MQRAGNIIDAGCRGLVSLTPGLVRAVLGLGSAGVLLAAPEIRVERVPENGLQPSARLDAKGQVQLVYLAGDPKAADIHYVTRERAGLPWSKTLTVNSQPGSAIAIGTVRGPRLATGPDNSVHVVWNGSSQALPKPVESSPLLYSRLNADRTAFAPQQAVGGDTRHLDGGASLAVGGDGQVSVIWHAAQPKTPPEGDDETRRGVFIANSQDGGKTFAAPRRIDEPGNGVCACCGLEAGFSDAQAMFVLYRGATGGSERGLRWMTSTDGGRTFTGQKLDDWQLTTCPMTTTHLLNAGKTSVAAWSSQGIVQVALLPTPAKPVNISGEGRRANHPVTARNAEGLTLVAWTEGTGWQKGGRLAYALLDANLRTIGAVTRQDGVPVWGSVAAWAEPDGSFTILF